jgi:hypothetical protein
MKKMKEILPFKRRLIDFKEFLDTMGPPQTIFRNTVYTNTGNKQEDESNKRKEN